MSSTPINQTEVYVKASDAAASLGYSSDYITKLAREGKILALRDGRKWKVSLESLKTFELKTKAEKERRAEMTRQERLRELAAHRAKELSTDPVTEIKTGNLRALAHTAIAACALLILGNLTYAALEANLIDTLRQSASFAFVSTTNDAPTLRTRPVTYQEATSDHPDFEGIVILEEDTPPATIESIRNSFSDDVIINEEAADTGYLTPVFRDHTGERYRYLLVPNPSP